VRSKRALCVSAGVYPAESEQNRIWSAGLALRPGVVRCRATSCLTPRTPSSESSAHAVVSPSVRLRSHRSVPRRPFSPSSGSRRGGTVVSRSRFGQVIAPVRRYCRERIQTHRMGRGPCSWVSRGAENRRVLTSLFQFRRRGNALQSAGEIATGSRRT